MSKILITGGAGFIGYFLTQRLAENPDNQIVVVDNLTRGRIDSEFEILESLPNTKLVVGDLTQTKFLASLDTDFDYVYHLAAVIGVQNVMEHPDKVLFVNALTTLQLFEHLKNMRNLKRVLFSSTSEIYAGTFQHFGIPVPTPEEVELTLDDITSNRTTYMLSKMYGESIAHNYGRQYGIPYTIVRYHNVYGPRMGFKHVIPELFWKVMAQNTVEIASPNHTRAFCYVDDAVTLTIGAVESLSGDSKTFNVGNSREEIKIHDLAERISEIVPKDIHLIRGNDTPGSPERRCPDTSLIEECLGYGAEINIDEGLRRTWNWYQDKLEDRYE